MVAAVVVYCAGSLGRVFSFRPYNNEAWFANPAIDLLVRHRMGTPVVAGAGTWLAGIDRHTYWTMPLYSLVQVPWYWCFGFSVVTQRMLTFVCGLILLGCVYALVKKLSSAWAATLSVVLISCDFEFLRQSGQGRMDMLCACLGFAGLAIYVTLRETNFGRALVLANVAAAASCMTHPCGVLPLTALWALMIYLDWKRLVWSDVVRALAPYVVVLGLWGAYISRDPASFVAQMKGNAKGMQAEIGGRERFSLLLHPLKAFHTEMQARYIDNYHSAIIPAIYLLGLVAIVVLAWRTRRRDQVAFALIGMIYFAELMVLEGLKRDFYLVHAVPALAMALAVVAFSLELRSRVGVAVVSLVVGGLVMFQGVTEVRYAWASHGPREYFAVVKLLEANYSRGEALMAPAEFAYRFGYYGGLVDDWRLGYYTGESPEFIVVGALTNDWLKQHRNDTPDFARFVDNRLGREYVVVLHNASYTVYARQERVGALRGPDGDAEHGSLAKMFWRLRPKRSAAGE